MKFLEINSLEWNDSNKADRVKCNLIQKLEETTNSLLKYPGFNLFSLLIKYQLNTSEWKIHRFLGSNHIGRAILFGSFVSC